jgi:hypothetical protein
MVLLFNVYITDQSSTGGAWEQAGIFYDRGNLDRPNKLDILKYSLASYAIAYPWKRVILNLQLDGVYNTEENRIELKQFVEEEFKNFDLYFSDIRNKHQEDYFKTYELINDDVIFYQCNHDHIFIDNSTDYLEELVKLREIYGPNLTISTSHWPEAIRTAKCGYMDHSEETPSVFSEKYQLYNNYIFREGKVLDSLIVITKEIYQNWFLEGDWNNIKFPPGIFASDKLELPRSEGVGVIGIGGIKDVMQSPFINQQVVIPYKELFRHFDGYYHQKITNNQCPAIDIPPGFFENNIKIRYGYDDYKEGWVNINPKNPNYYAHDKSGTDYKFTLKSIPLVWKNKIAVIDSNPNIDEEEMLQYHLKAVLEMIYTSPKYNPYIDKEVEDKIMKTYLKDYPEYSI